MAQGAAEVARLEAAARQAALTALAAALEADPPSLSTLREKLKAARAVGCVGEGPVAQGAAEVARLEARERELALAYHNLTGHSSPAQGRSTVRAANAMANFLSLTARGDNLSSEEKWKLSSAHFHMKNNFETNKKNSLYSLCGPRNQDPLLASHRPAHLCLVRAL